MHIQGVMGTSAGALAGAVKHSLAAVSSVLMQKMLCRCYARYFALDALSQGAQILMLCRVCACAGSLYCAGYSPREVYL